MTLGPEDYEYLANYCACCGKRCNDRHQYAELDSAKLQLSKNICPFLKFRAGDSIKILTSITHVLVPSFCLKVEGDGNEDLEANLNIWDKEEINAFYLCTQCMKLFSIIFVSFEQLKMLSASCPRSYIFEKIDKYMNTLQTNTTDGCDAVCESDCRNIRPNTAKESTRKENCSKTSIIPNENADCDLDPSRNNSCTTQSHSTAARISGAKRKAVSIKCQVCEETLSSSNAYVKHFRQLHDIYGPEFMQSLKTFRESMCKKNSFAPIKSQESVEYSRRSSPPVHRKKKDFARNRGNLNQSQEQVNTNSSSPTKRFKRKRPVGSMGIYHSGEHNARLKLISQLTSYSSTDANQISCLICDENFKVNEGYEHLFCYHRDNLLLSHKCQFCDMVFLTQDGLDGHKPYHTSKRPFLCNSCGKSYQSLRRLQDHDKVYHPPHRPIVCLICNRWFESDLILDEHTKKLHPLGDMNYFCIYFDCGRKFNTIPSIQLHMAKSHNNKAPAHCLKCNFQFQDRRSVFFHALTCPDLDREERNVSTDGSVATVKLSELPFHLDNDSDKNLKSKRLGIQSNSIDVNMSEVSEQRISRCRRRRDRLAGSKSQEILKKYASPAPDHCFSSENGGSSKSEAERKEQFLSCTLCKCITAKDFMVTHLVTRHNDECELEHLCDVCGKRFITQDMLKNHYRTLHKGPDKFSCQKCDKFYTSRRYLRTHIKIVHEKQRFVCAKCPKELHSKTSLKRHEQKHEGATTISLATTLFTCSFPDCGKSFASRRYHMEHEDIHTGIKRYNCGNCGKRFRQACNYNTHLRLKQCVRLETAF